MPAKPKFMHPSKLLRPSEIESICRALVGYGIDQIRITGGEPTLRREFRDIVTKLAKLPLSKLGMTSNGLLLSKHLEFLKDNRCFHINISLDSLNRERFNKITRTNTFDEVVRTVGKAQAMGFNLCCFNTCETFVIRDILPQ
jgi:cyclic pyranopterin phosphate synthase